MRSMAAAAAVAAAISVIVPAPTSAQFLTPVQQRQNAPAAPPAAAPAQAAPAQAAPAQGAPATPVQPTPAPSPEDLASRVTLEGFRSARFGMTMDQVTAAIRRDFNVAADAIRRSDNQVERTKVLVVSVRDLVPDSGQSLIAYVFGHKSERLFQVNVVWGTLADAQVDPQKVLATANALRNLFASQGYRNAGQLQNHRAPDGSTVVFRGFDRSGRMTQLQLTEGTTRAEGDNQDRPAVVLRLTYMQDPESPDVFRIEGGF